MARKSTTALLVFLPAAILSGAAFAADYDYPYEERGPAPVAAPAPPPRVVERQTVVVERPPVVVAPPPVVYPRPVYYPGYAWRRPLGPYVRPFGPRYGYGYGRPWRRFY